MTGCPAVGVTSAPPLQRDDRLLAGFAVAAAPVSRSDAVAAEAPAAEPATSSVAPPAQDRQILNASGYITARRIATVSSEITGLITEVNVEEGMIVEPGQVLARLDNALAKVDLDLEVARLASLQASVEGIEASLAEALVVLDTGACSPVTTTEKIDRVAAEKRRAALQRRSSLQTLINAH